MTMRISLAIDVEPGPRLLTRPSETDWDGVRAAIDLARRLRDELAPLQTAPPAFTWLLRMDPQIGRVYGDGGWIAARFGEQLDALEREGDDVGLHTHLYRWDDRRGEWITDYASTEWMTFCVQEAVAAYRATRSRPPRFHSFGDRYFSQDAVAVLEEAGIEVDMSIEPGLFSGDGILPGETLLGRLPDTTDAPRRMWRPARGDYLRPDPGGSSRLLLVPVTTYRFPLWMEPGRRIEHFVRKRFGRKPGFDERHQRHVRVGCSQRGYVFRHGARSASATAGESMHFVLRADQAIDRRTQKRILRNLRWLASGGLGTAVELVSTSALLAAERAGAAACAPVSADGRSGSGAASIGAADTAAPQHRPGLPV